MSKIIVPLHFAKLNSTPANVETGFKKFYLRGEWFKLYNGITEIDVVLDRPLDNYIPIPGIITASDTVLTAIEKLDYTVSNINTTTVWGSIIGNIIAQTDLIAYIAAQPADTLQQVTNAGNTTTFDIYANSFYTNTGYALMDDGTAIVDNVQFGSSLSYLDYNGAGFNVWQLPNQTGTIALTSDIGTWGALNYPTWVSGTPFVKMTAVGTFALDTTTYYPYPTGTISQYIRGDGTLATFPTILPDLLTEQTIDAYIGSRLRPTNTLSNGFYFSRDVNGSVGYTAINTNTGNAAVVSHGVSIDTNSYVKNVLVAKFGPNYFSSILAGKGGLLGTEEVFVGSTDGNDVSILTGTSYTTLTRKFTVKANGQLEIQTTPSTGTTSDFILLRDSSGNVKQIAYPTIPTGTVTGVTATSPITSSGGTTPIISTSMATNKLIGRSTAGTGVMEEITIGTGLTLSGGTLNGSATGVTSVGLTMPSAFTVTNSPITSTGDIAVTGAGLVSQYVRGDGTLANFPNSTGGGSSVNYYLNGSVSQGTFGGDTYYQLSKTPILGGGTNFIRTNGAGDGYIASFITDAGDPSQLNIPGGNWNVEFYFQSSATGGSPQFYAELYKVSATNVFTLVASGVANPEGITNGTSVDEYYTSIPVPQTSLLVTDRLAVRIYVITSGRTITLHTENGNLCEVLTTFTTGLTALNGLTTQVQNLTVGTSGTDFAISSSTDTHTFNLPTASASNRGALSSTDWSTFNNKQSGKSINVVSVNTSAGSASSTDYVYLASGTINITLPTAVGNQNLYTIKNVGTGVITVNTTSSETIDGSLTAPIRVQYLSLTLVSDGANWNII
jgi:hypothetical protein